MKLFSSNRRRIAAAVLLVLVLFSIRPGAQRLKSRIISSISSAVGRSVDIGSVHVRLLPRPGFDLENLVVYDDPAFGAEPILRASEVTAALRLTSLLRGHLEIARLDLTEPSLNLVHGDRGGWNLETLIERSAHTPLAPTAKTKSEPRPGFPYIQATGARINFKNGREKKPYALTNADFSLWQESENTWGVRLKAQPFRADVSSNDTGLLQMNGTWQRAATLRDTPLDFTLEWSRAQLGQVTKLFTGNDQGWRGAVQLDVTAKGTPLKLRIASDTAIQDFRRYDITTGEALRVAAHCDGQYSSLDHRIHALLCKAPLGDGVVSLEGEAGLPSQHSYSLTVSSENLPASAALALAQRAKRNLPEDLTTSGTIRGNVSIQRRGAASKLELEGQGEISDFLVASAANKADLGPETVPFVFVSDASSRNTALKRQKARGNPPGLRAPEGPHVEFGPFAIAHATAQGLTAQGWINRGGYNVAVTGEAEIGKTLRLARLAGLPALQSAAEGTAIMNLQIAGAWKGWGSSAPATFPGPQMIGTAKLHNVQVAVRGASGALEIVSADLQLAPDMVRVAKLNAKAADAAWTGSVELPRGCGTPASCEVHFDLVANQIVISDLRKWAIPRPRERSWYQVLGASANITPPFLETLRASGRVATDNLHVQNLGLTRASASVQVDRGKLQISDFVADVFGGKQKGDWLVDLSVKPAVCSGSGKLTGASLARLADATKDAWISGTATATYELRGPCTAELWQTGEGNLQFDVRDGALTHISLAEDEGPLKFARLSAQARLDSGKFEIKDGKLDSQDGKFLISGTLSAQRELEIKLSKSPNGSAGGYAITGTLAAPRVAPLPGAEQARLKPEPPK